MMENINLNKKQFNNLKELELPKDLFVAESKLYIFPVYNGWNSITKLFKKFEINNKKLIENKLKTIKTLINFKELINIKEIVFPEKIVLIENEFAGYTMELVKSINLEQALESNEISNERKIKYFIQIGEILEKMDSVRKYTQLKDFYLNDIHENNFIIDLNTDSIRVIDIDSCKINNNLTYTIGSRYLQANTIASKIPKYKQDETFVYGCSFIPSKDTDLYCYNIMILNFLYGGGIDELTIEEVYDYLEYLLSIGVDLKLVNIFKKVLSNSPNENPYKYLNELIKFCGKAHKTVYKIRRTNRF